MTGQLIKSVLRNVVPNLDLSQLSMPRMLGGGSNFYATKYFASEMTRLMARVNNSLTYLGQREVYMERQLIIVLVLMSILAIFTVLTIAMIIRVKSAAMKQSSRNMSQKINMHTPTERKSRIFDDEVWLRHPDVRALTLHHPDMRLPHSYTPCRHISTYSTLPAVNLAASDIHQPQTRGPGSSSREHTRSRHARKWTLGTRITRDKPAANASSAPTPIVI